VGQRKIHPGLLYDRLRGLEAIYSSFYGCILSAFDTGPVVTELSSVFWLRRSVALIHLMLAGEEISDLTNL